MSDEPKPTTFEQAIAAVETAENWSGSFQDAYLGGFKAALVTAVDVISSDAFEQGVQLGLIVGRRLGYQEGMLLAAEAAKRAEKICPNSFPGTPGGEQADVKQAAGTAHARGNADCALVRNGSASGPEVSAHGAGRPPAIFRCSAPTENVHE